MVHPKEPMDYISCHPESFAALEDKLCGGSAVSFLPINTNSRSFVALRMTTREDQSVPH